MNFTETQFELFIALCCVSAFAGGFLAYAVLPIILSFMQFLTRFMPLPENHFMKLEELNDEIFDLRESLIEKKTRIRVLSSGRS